MQTTEYLNPNLPKAQITNDGIGGKYDNMQKSFGRIQDFSAVGNIERDNDEKQTEEYDSKYTQEDIAFLDAAQHKGLRKWKTPASCKRDCVKVPKKVKA